MADMWPAMYEAFLNFEVKLYLQIEFIPQKKRSERKRKLSDTSGTTERD